MVEWLRCTDKNCFYKARHCHPAGGVAARPGAIGQVWRASPRLQRAGVTQQDWERLTADIFDPVPMFRCIAQMARRPYASMIGIADIADIAEAAVELFSAPVRLPRLVHELAASDPTYGSEVDSSPCCIFCHSLNPKFDDPASHDPTCLWRRVAEQVKSEGPKA